MHLLISTLKTAVDTNVKQCIGDLARNWGTNGKAEEYCVLGVFGCAKGLINADRHTYNYEAILRAYELPDDLITLDYNFEFDFEVEDITNGRYARPDNLYELLYMLNDDARLSFAEILEFLQVTFEEFGDQQ